MLISCAKDPIKLENEQFLIFGTYNGLCPGNCTSLFKLENGEVYADDFDFFQPTADFTFEETALEAEKYQIASQAYEELPEKLLAASEKSFGCPGCLDQEIIFLSYFDGAEHTDWQVDSDVDALPDYLKDYAVKIMEIVEALGK